MQCVAIALLPAGCGTERVLSVAQTDEVEARSFAPVTIESRSFPALAATPSTLFEPIERVAARSGVEPTPASRAIAAAPIVLPEDPADVQAESGGSTGESGESGGSGGGSSGNSATPIGYLDIPGVGISTFILENGWNVKQLNRGGTGIGDGDLWSEGNVVLFGHRTSHGGVFRHVADAEVGAEVMLTRGDGTTRTYRIAEKFLDMPDAVGWADPSNTVGGQPTITMITCAHPDGRPGGTARRWFVRAVAV